MQTERLSNGRNVRSLRKFNEARWQQRCNFGSCNKREMLQWKRTTTQENIALIPPIVMIMDPFNIEELFEALKSMDKICLMQLVLIMTY